MFTENSTDKFIDLKELTKILLLTDVRGATKWCENAKINIQVIGQKRVVYKFLVDMELDKKLVSELKAKYPQKWEELYRCYKDNDRLGYLHLLEDNPSNVTPISSFSKPETKYAKAFADS